MIQVRFATEACTQLASSRERFTLPDVVSLTALAGEGALGELGSTRKRRDRGLVLDLLADIIGPTPMAPASWPTERGSRRW